MRKSAHKPTYETWKAMKARCRNVSCSNFKYYGAIGINYDDKWESYDEFVSDMGHRPDGKTLDRIDSNKGYSKENCRWSSPAEQQRNRRYCKHITYNGETKTATEWSRELGFAKGTIYNRVILKNWPVEQAMTIPKGGSYRL